MIPRKLSPKWDLIPRRPGGNRFEIENLCFEAIFENAQREQRLKRPIWDW
jgi:hypothetical protein